MGKKNDVAQKIKLHLKGHGWRMWAHDSEEEARITPGTSMRKYVKSWVTQWDFLRLFPGEECEIESTSWKPSYDETPGTQDDTANVSAAPIASTEVYETPSNNPELTSVGISPPDTVHPVSSEPSS